MILNMNIPRTQTEVCLNPLLKKVATVQAILRECLNTKGDSDELAVEQTL